MSISTLLTTPPEQSTCPDCGEAVVRSADILLDPDPVAGGLYEIARGHRRRRPLTELTAEIRAHRAVHGGGYDRHECPPPLHWTDR